VKKAQAWINQILLKDWSAEDLNNSKILYPVSNNIAARWMLEAGFKYERHKKSYYVDRHEDTDVLADRNKYMAEFFDEELLEHCWMQLSKRVYLQNKCLKSLSALKIITKIKQERKAKDTKDTIDVSAAVTKYLDAKAYHYRNDAGEEMVEVHADWLYSYDESDEKLPKGIPPIPKYGGNLSICIKPPNVKPRFTFGQDEAISRSSQLNESCWAIDGQQTLRTKSMGVGRMVSALCS
jgi:hypothetical protein